VTKIMIKLEPTCPDVDAALKSIAATLGVEELTPVFPDPNRPGSQTYEAQVPDDDAEKLRERVASNPDVRRAHIPPQRRIVHG